MKLTLKYLFLFIAVMCGCAGNRLMAQDSLAEATPDASASLTVPESSESHFMVVGLVTFGFVNQNTTTTLGGIKTTDKTNSLGDADRFELSPMFLWRHGNNMLIEFEPSYNGSTIGVNWADVSYFIAPGFIARAGYLTLPFGIYTKRLAAGWINKLASDPIGVDMAGSDFGVELEGGFPLGSMKWSYDVSLSNGFQLNNYGTISGVGIVAANNGKTFCGRLALLPFANSSLEVGVSALYGSLAAAPGATFTNTDITNTKGPSVNMYAADINFVKNINPIQLNIKGQYSMSAVNTMNYVNPTDSTQKYSFTNNVSSAFAQVSVRPVQAQNKVLKNLELAYRYVTYQSPQNSTWGQNYTESDIALDYWLSWRTVVKVAYENINASGTSSVALTGTQGTSLVNRMIIQFSTEF